MDRRWAWAAGGILAASACLSMDPRVAQADLHKDEELGFSIQMPQGWRQIPIAGAEQYIVAKYQSDREWVDKKEGFSFRPEIKVILFDPKAKKTADVKDEGDGFRSISIKNPYRTYKDYVKSDGEGGRYISKEEEITVNGVGTTWFEVAYEKLTVPRHGLAYVYHAEDVDYCATVEVLEDNWTKLSPMLFNALKSFKIFPRKGSIKRETTGEGNVTVTADLSKLSPEERAKARAEKFERDLKLATSRLPDGWIVRRSKNYVAISHADAKFTDRFLEQCEAVRAWADTNLGWFGDGIPGQQTFRICKDSDEERSFKDISSRSGGWSREITTSRDDGISGFRWVSGEIFDSWLDEKNPELSWSLSPWLSHGIRSYIGSALVRGGKLVFTDVDTIVALRMAAKQKKLILPKVMVQMSYDDMVEWDKKDQGGSDNGPKVGGIPIPMPGFGMRASAYDQAAGFVRYLFAGPGKSNARTKDLLHTYVQNLQDYVKNEEHHSVDADSAPKTEEEEEKRFKDRKGFWKDHQKDMLKAVFDKTFSAWTDADWSSVDKSYTAFAS